MKQTNGQRDLAELGMLAAVCYILYQICKPLFGAIFPNKEKQIKAALTEYLKGVNSDSRRQDRITYGGNEYVDEDDIETVYYEMVHAESSEIPEAFDIYCRTGLTVEDFESWKRRNKGKPHEYGIKLNDRPIFKASQRKLGRRK